MASYMLPRPFAYNASRFRFTFRLHLVAITLVALIAVLLIRLSPRLLIVAYMMIIVLVSLVALTILNAMPPVRTTHAVDGEFVILRQGLNFKLAIPLGKISKAKRTEIGTGRAGINLDRANGVLEVIASGPEAVRLRLNDPVVHKGTLVREVLVDVLEPREFIDCIRERKKGAVLMNDHRLTPVVSSRMKRLDGGKGAVTPAEEEPPGAEDEAPEGPEHEEPEVLASPPPVSSPKAPARAGPPREPDERPPPKGGGLLSDEPEEPVDEPVAPAKEDDADEIELVPAFPSKEGGRARVVRIPRRKT